MKKLKGRNDTMPDITSAPMQKYFIGANTSRGFINCCDGAFSKLSRIYIIKGGPGTGKSTFMKKIAGYAEEHGKTPIYYYCSSDPDSLDAIVIPDAGIAITDGTSPHIFEAKYPGAKEEYLNFGEFWNGGFLSLCFSKIEEYSKIKSKCFSSSYRYLSISESVRNERESVLSQCFDNKKAEGAVSRLMRDIGTGKGFTDESRQISSFGMKGRAKFDTYSYLCEKVVGIRDKRGASPFIFDAILKKAEEQGLMTYISKDNLCRTEAVMFPEKKTCIILLCEDDECDKVINTERFMIAQRYSENRRRLRFLLSLEEELTGCALSELEAARDAHFSLENIYSEAMDFEALSHMTKAFSHKLFGK